MSNLAYSLTGQWDQIDYSAIKAKDNILSKRGYSLGPGKCDLILSLGDMTDVPNDTGYGNHVASSAATLTSLGYDYQNETNREFWSIIKASGVPYIPNQGNHDPWVWFQSLMTMLDYENESFYYDHEATYGLSYAMLVPTNLGRPLCVLSVGFSDELFDPATFATRSANTYAWVAATVGCGGNYPTIYISHYTLLNNAAPGGAGARTLATTTGYTPYALPGVTGARELFMAAGGHDTSNVSAKSSYTGLFGTDADATVYTFFSNWQEHLRRPSLANGDSYSNKDGYGTMYTVVSIDAGNKRLCAHDWSPYWQSQSTTGNGQATSVDTTSACFDFDFDAR